MSTPNTWAKATVRNDWGGAISNVQLKHRYDNDHFDQKSWDFIADQSQGDTFDVGYWTGFGRTGYDYWLITFEADGKVWTCKDNFYCFLTGDDQGGLVVCRLYKEGDAGQMEVMPPQSSHATVGLSSQPLATGAGAKGRPGASAAGKGTTCDGTLAPSGIEQRWRAAVLAGLTELQQRNQPPGSGCQFGTPGDRFGQWDKENWTQDYSGSARGDKASYSPLLRPYDAVLALVKNLNRWTLDCATYGEVALLDIWRYFLRTEPAFNAAFDGLVLKNQHSTKLPMEDAVVVTDEEARSATFDAAWDCAVPGTKVSWKNRRRAAAGSDYEHEFAVKRRDDGPGGKPTYDAFPLGWDLTEGEIVRLLAEQAGDFPKSFKLETDAIDHLVAEEAKEKARLRVLHTAMAQAVGAKDTERLPAQVIDKLRKEVADNWYPNRIAFEKALGNAGVPDGFVGQLKEAAKKKVDEALAGDYVTKNIYRYDYSLPKIR